MSTTYHVHSEIDALLKRSDEELAAIFPMDGEDARDELKALKKKGHKYIGSEKCKNFDPVKGCPGHPVEESPLYNSANKQLTEVDIDFYLEILFTFPEGKWFHPTNGDEKTKNNAYTICGQLYEARLICRKAIPLWVNGSFRGLSIAYYYDRELDYKAHA